MDKSYRRLLRRTRWQNENVPPPTLRARLTKQAIGATSGAGSPCRRGAPPMQRLTNRRAMIGFVAASLLCAAASAARALDVGPKDLPLTVAGVPVQIPVAGSIDVHTDADAITLQATATGDLHAIQDHALAIARGLRLPRDPCARKNVNVIIKSLDAASITPRGDSAVVDLSGHVGVWLCGKVLGQTQKPNSLRTASVFQSRSRSTCAIHRLSACASADRRR